MSGFFSTSVGRKVLMSLTGLFLILFLLVHLVINSMIVFDDKGELFNKVAHFMGTNPVIKIVEPILAMGLFLHLFFASVITIQNHRKLDAYHFQLSRYKKYNVLKV
jgi:succinate dehydrogenase / fumarate reductase cytochrome b subunit